MNGTGRMLARRNEEEVEAKERVKR